MPQLTGDNVVCIVVAICAAAVIIVGILKGYEL